MYESLKNEVDTINRAYGWEGFTDALTFINAHSEEYKGTAVWRQFEQFFANNQRQVG